jgi:hypothetical protein
MDFVKALRSLRPGALWTLDGESYAGLVWQDSSAKPTEAELVQSMEDAAKAANEAEKAHVAALESVGLKLAELGLTSEEVTALTT